MTIPRGRHAPPLHERQARDRRRLFNAARVLVEAEGFQRLTVEKLTVHAGISKQTFYVLWENLAAFNAELLDRMERALLSDPEVDATIRALLLASIRAGRQCSSGTHNEPGLWGPHTAIAQSIVAQLDALGYQVMRVS